MRPRRPEHRERLSRRWYGLLATAFALFAIYGSLVPFDVHPLPIDRAWSQFSSVLSGPVSIDSRTDFVTNVLLFVPLGYLMLAALGTDRAGRRRLGAAALLTIACCFVLSAAIEFTQTWVPDRTVALSDIVAETIGATLGSTVWLAVGASVTAWLRALMRQGHTPALTRRLLLAYCIGFFISQTLPLDLTINLGQLAQKYRHGMIELRPFAYVHASWPAAAWDDLTNVVLTVPIGVAAVLLWTKRSRRRASEALMLGIGAVAAVELVQVFVGSRYADVTDVITGSIGVAVGVAATSKVIGSDVLTSVRRRPDRVVVVARILTSVWVAVLFRYHWRPFNFSFDNEQVTAGAHRLLMIPFYSYFLVTPFHAFGEMATKSLFGLLLGGLARLAWPTDRAALPKVRAVVLASAGLCLFLVIEVGQVFLPTRAPDITDAIVGEAGFIAGMWAVGLIGAARRQDGLMGRPIPGAAPPASRSTAANTFAEP